MTNFLCPLAGQRVYIVRRIFSPSLSDIFSFPSIPNLMCPGFPSFVSRLLSDISYMLYLIPRITAQFILFLYSRPSPLIIPRHHPLPILRRMRKLTRHHLVNALINNPFILRTASALYTYNQPLSLPHQPSFPSPLPFLSPQTPKLKLNKIKRAKVKQN